MLLRRPVTAFAGDMLAGIWSDELPGTGVELVLELDGRWEVDVDGRTAETAAFAAGLVAGPVRTRARGPVRLVQLSIDPLAVPALLGVPAGRLTPNIVAWDAVQGRDGSRFLEALDDAGDDAAALAERWALQSADDARHDPLALTPPADVCRAVALLRASGGALRVAALATELGCSRRHLARRFAEWVGVSPSEFARLLRFEHATGALERDPDRPLGELAFAAGYADHAHMAHEFQALASATPGAVAARHRAAVRPSA